jgi:hypothetical protein
MSALPDELPPEELPDAADVVAAEELLPGAAVVVPDELPQPARTPAARAAVRAAAPIRFISFTYLVLLFGKSS